MLPRWVETIILFYHFQTLIGKNITWTRCFWACGNRTIIICNNKRFGRGGGRFTESCVFVRVLYFYLFAVFDGNLNAHLCVLFSTTWTSKGCRPGAAASETAARTEAVPALAAKAANWVVGQARMGPCDSSGWGGGARGTDGAPASRSCSSEPVLRKRARNPSTHFNMASNLPEHKPIYTTGKKSFTSGIWITIKLPDKFAQRYYNVIKVVK